MPDTANVPVDPAAPPAAMESPSSTVEVAPNIVPNAKDIVTAPERPTWLPEKFKTGEDLAKSYTELEKSFHAKLPQVPDKYDIELPPGVSEIDTAWMKDAKLTKEQAQAVIVHYTKNVLPALDAQRQENEMVRLSGKWSMPDRQSMVHRIGQVETWAKQHLPPVVVGELSKTAEGVASMYDMMRAGTKTFFGPQASEVPRLSAADLQSQVADPRYESDPAYRQRVEQAYREFYDR